MSALEVKEISRLAGLQNNSLLSFAASTFSACGPAVISLERNERKVSFIFLENKNIKAP